MAREKFYQRLTRPRSGLGTRTSLWLGPDHLLLVTSTGFSESYQRFYFRDIRCFSVMDSSRAGIITGVLVLLLVILAVIMIGAFHDFYDGTVAWMIPGVPLLGVLVWNIALGRACRTRIMTGVQTTELPPLSRFRRTRKVMARLNPLIEAAQNALVPPPVAEPAETGPAIPQDPLPFIADDPSS